jgi:hypothetical protein
MEHRCAPPAGFVPAGSQPGSVHPGKRVARAPRKGDPLPGPNWNTNSHFHHRDADGDTGNPPAFTGAIPE